MAKYNIDISEPAENDLRDIVLYIFTQLSAPTSAIKIMNEIEEAIQALSDMPQRCPLLTDERLASIGYRKLIVKNYIVFFTINETTKVVDIVRILYARRDWQHIL
jgi:plasmid stabilization system protein ParE